MLRYPILLAIGFAFPFVLGAQEFVEPEKIAVTDREKEIAAIFADAEVAEPNGPDFDRRRGQLIFHAEDAEYVTSDHIGSRVGNWHWPEFTPQRWGNYKVEVTYVSLIPKMGVQFSIGDSKAKGYLPQSGHMSREHSTVISRLYIPDTDPELVGLLSGDDSNGPSFRLRRVTLTPGPEGERINQSIDGHIELQASMATTFSEKMRYEPKPEKNCLGFWTEVEDWAEWKFSVHNGGKFELHVVYGCGKGNEGSTMGVWFNDNEMAFDVEDTGGFQSWKTISLGEVEAKDGRHLITVKPKSKANKAVADIHKIILKPVSE